MKKLFRRIHLWLSVPFGLIIIVICLSGAALVFEKEVMELCRPHLYYINKVGDAENKTKPVPLSVERIAESVAATLPDSVYVTNVSASSRPDRTWKVGLSYSRHAAVYVDPYTGEIKGKYQRAPFFSTMFRLHRWLLDGMKPGGGILHLDAPAAGKEPEKDGRSRGIAEYWRNMLQSTGKHLSLQVRCNAKIKSSWRREFIPSVYKVSRRCVRAAMCMWTRRHGCTKWSLPAVTTF